MSVDSRFAAPALASLKDCALDVRAFRRRSL